MSAHDLASKAKELKEMKIMQQELSDVIAALEEEIKAEMIARGTDTITAGVHIIRWTAYTAKRIDAKALRDELPEIAERYTLETTTRRFSVA